MAARKRRVELDDSWREKIQTSMLINRLNQNALGKLESEMTAGQLKSAEILLRKTIPDLSASENKTQVEINYIARMPQPVRNGAEWQEQHAAPLTNPTLQ